MRDARRRACLEAIGIELWSRRAPGKPEAGVEDLVSSGCLANPDRRSPDVADAAAPDTGPPVLDSVSSLDWEALRAAVSDCHACPLHETRTQTVFGVGDPDARLMIVGEAPGAEEDRQGEPFVGRAGQLLSAMLAAIGLRREQVYIANIIKCRPPGNRDPHSEEAASCQPYLHRQIELIRPSLILSVGRVSAHSLLGTEESVGRLRGRTHRFDPGDIPLIVTYHPAYLLRRPQEKAKAWQDLQSAHRLLATS
jgi:uracil-DNA glycosylase family 4